MGMSEIIKTNVMRLLDQKKIEYTPHFVELKEAVSGVELAKLLNEDETKVFKTLATLGASKRIYLFLIPVAASLNLKKAAKACNEKSIEMLKSKDLLANVGYVHGSTSPIGTKKMFKTFIHESANECDTIMFSAGKIGYQVELKLKDLSKIIQYQLVDLID